MMSNKYKFLTLKKKKRYTNQEKKKTLLKPTKVEQVQENKSF